MDFFHGPNFHNLIFFLNQFAKCLGPSLGVNRMWTKKNDHAPKNECADFLNICPKKENLKRKNSSLIIFFSLVFVFSSTYRVNV